MKLKFLAAVALAAVAVTGCVSTVNDSHSFATSWSQDTITARYNRSQDQVYQASVQVIANNGVLVREYITPGTNSVVRSLEATVNQKKVWIRVNSVDPKTSQVEVQARNSWGSSEVGLASEINTEIALQLAR